MLSENDKAGPEDSEAVGQAKTKQKGKPGPPPVARADPHRNRHWKDNQDPEAGSGSDLLTFDPNFHANRDIHDIHPQVFVVASFPKVGHHRWRDCFSLWRLWHPGCFFGIRNLPLIYSTTGWWQLKHFIFLPLFGEMIQFDYFFSNGLVQPPTRLVFIWVVSGGLDSVVGSPKMKGILTFRFKSQTQQFTITHTIHVWYTYLHLVDFYGKCH